MSMGGIRIWKEIQLCSTPEEGDGAPEGARYDLPTGWSWIEGGYGRQGRAEATSTGEVERTTWA